MSNKNHKPIGMPDPDLDDQQGTPFPTDPDNPKTPKVPDTPQTNHPGSEGGTNG